MTNEHRAPKDPDLRQFLESAGRSLSFAQGDLAEGSEFQAQMVLASAELEAKVALESDPSGALLVHPVSAGDLQSRVQAAALSTLRVQYVATAPEAEEEVGTAPTLDPEEVSSAVRDRADIARLEAILGGMKIVPTFVAESGRWLVTVNDPGGRLVREIVVPDERRE